MSFTPEQRQVIANAIMEKRAENAPAMKCPVCYTSNWSIGDGVVRMVLQYNVGIVTLAGPSYPLIPLLCSNCGNTLLLNAFTLGVAELLGIHANVPAALPPKGEGGNG
jgi:hypothetical protein